MMELKSCDEMNAEQQLAYKLGAASLTPADILAALPGVEKRWECYWAPMNYLKCDPFTKRHAPEFCGWRLIVPLSEEE
jgi:hypothetical protein